MAPRTLRSWQNEESAARMLRARGWEILYHNVEVAGVQVDLIGRDPNGMLTILEVKSQSALAHLSRKQKSRLMRVGSILSAFERVRLVFAQVAGHDVRLLPVDGLTD